MLGTFKKLSHGNVGESTITFTVLLYFTLIL